MKYCYQLDVQGHGNIHYLKMIFNHQIAEDGYYFHRSDLHKVPEDIRTLMERINEVQGVSRIGEKAKDILSGGHIHVESNLVTVKLSTFDVEQIRETAREIAKLVARMFEFDEVLFYLYEDVEEDFRRLNASARRPV
jgi:uncharacterized protein with PhoU and TrkA domain